MKKKIIIIGAGLAGLSLAYSLKKKGHKVLLFDKGNNHSSTIAAGMVNPMVFRRMNKSWRLDEFLPEAISFYQQIEKVLQVKCYHPIPILRCFSSTQEKQWWKERENEIMFENYLFKHMENNHENPYIKSEFGTGIVNQAFWINAKVFIDAFQNFFLKEQELIKEPFEAELLDINSKLYGAYSYDHIVFCVGAAQKEFNFFRNIPIQQTKGQILTMQTNKLSEEYSINRKCFVIPTGKQSFKVGATYEWNNDTLECTKEGLEEIKEKLSNLFVGDYKVIKQEAGIRPTVRDRRPVLGRSNENPDFFIFNGLGTKGYMMSPLLAKEMTEFIIEGKEPPKEYNSNRFS